MRNIMIPLQAWGDFPYFSLSIDSLLNINVNLETDKRYYEEIKILINELLKEGMSKHELELVFREIARSSLTAYYTDQKYVELITSNLLESNLDKINTSDKNNSFKILDPCTGTGVFIKMFRDKIIELQKNNRINDDINIEIYGIEPEPISYHISSFLEQEKNGIKIEIFNKNYQSFNPDIKFDIISSNIPFGSLRISDDKIIKERVTIHNYFFLKSSILLNESGHIGFITSSNFLNSRSNEKNREVFFNQGFELKNLIRLPKETFDLTEVETDYLQVQKSNYKKEESLIRVVQIKEEDLEIAEENNPSKTPTLIHHINQYVYENRKDIYIGELSTNFMHNSYKLSSTLNDRDKIKLAFENKLKFDQESQRETKNLKLKIP